MIILNAVKILFTGLILAVAAWFAAHFLAVFGVFVIVGFIVYWILFPDKRFCLLCRLNKSGECVFCRSGHGFKAMLINSALIFFVTVLAVGSIIIEYSILKFVGFPKTQKTVTFVIPPKGQHRIGEIFPMQINITGIKTPINAVQADIGFDSSELSVVDVSTKDSFADVFIQKEINNDGGWVRVTGGLPNPGFASDHGVFGTIFFQAKTSGLTQVKFLSSSMVLANDGKGTNVLKDFPSASYLVIPDRLSPAELEQQQSLLSGSPKPVLGANSDQPEGDVQIDLSSTAPSIQVVKDNVLGANTLDGQKPVVESEPTLLDKAFGIVTSVDEYIVNLLTRMFSFRTD